jgi:hypothetical protein
MGRASRRKRELREQPEPESPPEFIVQAGLASGSGTVQPEQEEAE